ncbi:uncharacterized protein LOC113067575 [Carassius auratus]|uniref:Uncharacterized protein LOC113067575 n=1 Tax=Carassius auratus TaxID=7957 RepID=A0A6P6MH08_CARAU|nr:uncharacterized protein LOC113067575 [Carassius auratus]
MEIPTVLPPWHLSLVLVLPLGLARLLVGQTQFSKKCKDNQSTSSGVPKVAKLKRWLAAPKSLRGSGQRKTTSLAQDSQGYTAKILKTSSNNGKNGIYIIPLQEEIDITQLPYNAPEFHNMPKNICMTCGISVPLQLLPCHLEDCQSNNAIESESDKEKETEEAHGLSHESDVICLDACPICGEEFSAEVMPYHASTCGESFPETFPSIMDGNSVDETASLPSQSTAFQLDPDHLTPGPSVSAESAPSMCDDWKRIELPERAAIQYRRCALRQKEDEPPLKVRIDIREDMEDQEGRIIHFYKKPNILSHWILSYTIFL